MSSKNYFESHPPTFSNNSPFLGFNVPGSQTFTSFSPSSDMNAYLNAVTGLSGWEQRNLLQSSHGTQVLSQATKGKLKDSVSYLDSSTYHSRSSCQQDADCPHDQVCYTFNDQVFGPQQGPTCSPTVFPEVKLGNKYNKGVPLRQYSNYCLSDDDCKGTDEFSGQAKRDMICNHYYRGPDVYDKTGLCQVEYESKGKRYTLSQPPGWDKPLETKLHSCESNEDCGASGINGWTRCTSAGDGKKYCLWPSQTDTQNPSQANKLKPHSNMPSSIYENEKPGSKPEPSEVNRFK